MSRRKKQRGEKRRKMRRREERGKERRERNLREECKKVGGSGE